MVAQLSPAPRSKRPVTILVDRTFAAERCDRVFSAVDAMTTYAFGMKLVWSCDNQ